MLDKERAKYPELRKSGRGSIVRFPKLAKESLPRNLHRGEAARKIGRQYSWAKYHELGKFGRGHRKRFPNLPRNLPRKAAEKLPGSISASYWSLSCRPSHRLTHAMCRLEGRQMHHQEYRKMLSTSGAAEYLGVGKSTLDKWRLIGGGQVLHTRSSHRLRPRRSKRLRQCEKADVDI